MHEDPRCSRADPIFAEIEQPGVGRLLANTSPLAFSADGRMPPQPAPRLGQDTEAVLTQVLGLSAADQTAQGSGVRREAMAALGALATDPSPRLAGYAFVARLMQAQ